MGASEEFLAVSGDWEGNVFLSSGELRVKVLVSLCESESVVEREYQGESE